MYNFALWLTKYILTEKELVNTPLGKPVTTAQTRSNGRNLSEPVTTFTKNVKADIISETDSRITYWKIQTHFHKVCIQCRHFSCLVIFM